MPKILIVEDEQQIVDFVLVYLKQPFEVDIAMDGDRGLEQFKSGKPDLVILDLGLPGLDGLELFKEMRRLREDVPVIMLTARKDEVDRVLGLELGADDYVTKPFSGRELAARAKNVLRRTSTPAAPTDETVREGPFILNLKTSSLMYFGEPVPLTRTELNLMVLLIRSPRQTFDRSQIIRHIYEDEFHAVTDRSIDAYVKRLRKKFADIRPGTNPIETVHTFGYRLNRNIRGEP